MTPFRRQLPPFPSVLGTSKALPAVQRIADKAFSALERFLHIEAVSGIVLLIAAAVALMWANSPYASTYTHFWHLPLSFGIGDFVISNSLHFWINDALMTVFFLVVGMEIRREIHEGALANLKLAALPMVAAFGGVMVPALLYLAFNSADDVRQGWAVPTATDIAFAVGVLALLGRSVPSSVQVFLLALAIIDDIVAVLIIALFYSGERGRHDLPPTARWSSRHGNHLGRGLPTGIQPRRGIGPDLARQRSQRLALGDHDRGT